nr:MAG TPA: 7-cyano-7-deazaguanine reductase [Caudoviricetes sp.]
MSKQDISRTEKELTGVTLLGNTNTDYKYDYDPSVLEHFPNKHPENDYVVTFDGYEFTSLCPKTGQPDFAKVFINYIPNEKMVESKSLKLYLFSFRNHGDFHEDCMNIILNDLYALMEPKYIEVMGLFTPRGGISIYPFVNKVNPNFETPELKQLELSRKLNFMSGVQNYGRAIR